MRLPQGVPTSFVWLLAASTLIAAACARRPLPASLTLVGFGLEAGELLKRDAVDDFTSETGIGVHLIPA